MTVNMLSGDDGNYWCVINRQGGCFVYSEVESDDRWESPLEVPYDKWCQNCSRWDPDVRIQHLTNKKSRKILSIY